VSSMRNALGAKGDERPARADAGHPNGSVRSASDSDHGGDQRLAQLRRGLRAHPCHGCSDLAEHLRWADRRERAATDNRSIQRRIEGRTASIARAFDRVCDVLESLDYLDGDTVTDHGQQLRRIYSQADLVVAECLRDGVWNGLDAPGLAAAVSILVYESRREGTPAAARPGSGRVAIAVEETSRVWARVRDLEMQHQLPPTPEPDAGFAGVVHRWARGMALADVLEGSDLTPGDFVRWCRQTLDLLDQVAALAGSDNGLRSAAMTAIAKVRRGVVESTLA